MAKFSSLFRTPKGEARYLAAYDRVMSHWPVPYETVDVPTRFGSTHAIISGPRDAPPLVLLHGNFASATMWHANVVDLSQRRRVYAVDIIGNSGKSRAAYLPRTRLDYAEWLVDVLCQLSLAEAAVVGLSYGAFLALNLALHSPALVTHLVLLSPDLPLAPATLSGLMLAAAMMLFPTQRTVGRFLQRTSSKGYEVDDPYWEQRIIGNTQIRSLWHLRPRVTEVEFQKLPTRTLMLWGEQEIMCNPRVALECARRLVPHLEAEIIPGAGHALNRDQPHQVNVRILEFIQS